MRYKKELCFPDCFYKFGDGVKITEDETNKWINDCINSINFKNDEYFTMTASGDTRVEVFKSFDELEVVVSNSEGYSTFRCYVEDIINNFNKKEDK